MKPAGALDELRAALAEKERRLAQVEQELLDLRAELDDFAREYNARVGARQAQLEALQERIAQARARRAFGTRREFSPGYASAEEQFRRTWSPDPPPQAEPAPAPAALDEGGVAELRKLYRELARAYHPDLARSDAERETRTRAMSEINAAYAARSLADLRELAGVARSRGDDFERRAPGDPAARLDWLRREAARLDELLAARERERFDLENGALMRLKVEVAVARGRGRDLLAETVRRVEQKIVECELELMSV